jgi:hypothetical protein
MASIIATTAPVVRFLNLRLHEDGALSIEGNVGDWRTCREMLDGAHAALRHRAEPKAGDPQPQTQMITETSLSK